ncbi:putative 2OG-Fe(II) oxygenase [Erythrobacter sanguineus]|uniref:Putative 2OG-Fe(II) oxygenase n=1 Tax=Erythrobacter sanguineus TaxID=198312 RepID=A0A1M7SD22_9SPHN|nr:putative 2OG-Fe(II) oxygenase [Erythrobacter sanguineus]SHN56398.1 Putative 2OG-Fe(II) oxygenase [Erythrobacter sanguineus]
MNDTVSHDMAQQALARGDPAALALFDRLLARDPGNARLWLGKAQALELAGDRRGARIVAQQIAGQAPGFTAALTYLAGMLLAAGEPDFAAPFRQAAARAPHDPNIPAAHVEALAAADLSAEAAAIAAEARTRFPHEPHFALLEAIHAGAAGEWDRADALYAALADDRPQRLLHEARHRLRGQDPLTAEHLLAQVLTAEPGDIAAWALRGIAWRLADDPRAAWLHEQAGLVRLQPLAARAGLIAEAAALLRDLHKAAALPLGQSLRGGTQTRGILFQRSEPVLGELHAAIRATLEAYRAALPPADADHPLLRHRDVPWRLAGSWSVRLTGGGDHHTAHIHPQGIVSSALYIVVPEEAQDTGQRQGWLEIGRPPPDLRLTLEPLAVIGPREGHLALFPSTLYHGTTPFGAQPQTRCERLTVAFDVIDVRAAPTSPRAGSGPAAGASNLL